MPKVTILKGLPASGKSTFAKQQVEKSKGEITRVNKDDLRAMLHGGIYSPTNERLIIQVRDKVITQSLKSGRDVIIDDTNLNPQHERQIRKLVGPKHKVEVIFFDTDMDTCIKRDSTREGTAKVGEDVIRRMAKQWNSWQHEDCTVDYPDPEEITYTDGAPDAIMVDLDGTLAHMHGRSPFDWKRCSEDTIDHPVYEMISAMSNNGYEIIYMSGRDEVCRPETEFWLKDNECPEGQLFMRPEGDQRKDSIVKRELFDANIRGKYNILFVADDRNQVVEEWREMGVKCFQVAEGDF